MSNNKQPVELTDITVSLLKASQGTVSHILPYFFKPYLIFIFFIFCRFDYMEDRDASTSTPIIDETTAFLLDCAERGKNRGKQPSPSICKVSSILRDLNESFFTPQLVSIGPIHREDPKLQEFEWLKECYLHDLLRRRVDSTPKETLEACLERINDLIPKIRESYTGVIINYSDVELARMMVMDGCFILEFCFKHEDEENLYLPNTMQNTRIAMDLMLLENQVPFSVLQALFECSMGEVPFTLSKVLDAYLAPYIKLFHSDLLPEKKSILGNVLDKYLALYIKLFRSLLPEKIPATDVRSESTHVHLESTHVLSGSTYDHVLGYLHKRYQLVAAKSLNPIQVEASKLVDEALTTKSWNTVDDETLRGHTIIELDRSGMNFKPHQEDEWSMTINFQSSLFPCLPWFGSKSTLLMPTMVIQDTTELILRNFIAYEQSLLQDRYYFTSYAHAMDKLIDTQEDIAKLVESKVLLNMLVSNQEAADMINNICKNMFVTDFYYAREFKQMDKYYNRFWPMIKRVYFGNPWNAINLLFGIIAFLATVVAAIFAVLQYLG